MRPRPFSLALDGVRLIGGEEAIFTKGRELDSKVESICCSVFKLIEHEHRFVIYDAFRTDPAFCRMSCRDLRQAAYRAK